LYLLHPHKPLTFCLRPCSDLEGSRSQSTDAHVARAQASHSSATTAGKNNRTADSPRAKLALLALAAILDGTIKDMASRTSGAGGESPKIATSGALVVTTRTAFLRRQVIDIIRTSAQSRAVAKSTQIVGPGRRVAGMKRGGGGGDFGDGRGRGFDNRGHGLRCDSRSQGLGKSGRKAGGDGGVGRYPRELNRHDGGSELDGPGLRGPDGYSHCWRCNDARAGLGDGPGVAVPEVVGNPDSAGLKVALGTCRWGSGGDEVEGRAGAGGSEDRCLSGSD
jgi:hypothetical protein